uniref:Transcription factor BTF3 n=1 Tax=Lygus hesperus TaxID=30085 RepID=A0A0A9WQ44_LYGHE
MPITQEQLRKRAELVRTGGKGSVRRTVKAHHKNSGEDRKVQNTVRRLGVTPLNEIDEAIFYRQDGSVMHFDKPKVQASTQTQCFVVSGDYQIKTAEEVAVKV